MSKRKTQDAFDLMLVTMRNRNYVPAFNPETGHCQYLTPEGLACHVGMLLSKDEQEFLNSGEIDTDIGVKALKARLSEQFPSLADLSDEFLSDAQHIHDAVYDDQEYKGTEQAASLYEDRMLGLAEQYRLNYIPPA